MPEDMDCPSEDHEPWSRSFCSAWRPQSPGPASRQLLLDPGNGGDAVSEVGFIQVGRGGSVVDPPGEEPSLPGDVELPILDALDRPARAACLALRDWRRSGWTACATCAQSQRRRTRLLALLIY